MQGLWGDSSGQGMGQEPAFRALRGLREARTCAQQLLPSLPPRAPTPRETEQFAQSADKGQDPGRPCTQGALSPVERQVTRGHKDSPGKSTHSMGHT